MWTRKAAIGSVSHVQNLIRRQFQVTAFARPGVGQESDGRATPVYEMVEKPKQIGGDFGPEIGHFLLRFLGLPFAPRFFR